MWALQTSCYTVYAAVSGADYDDGEHWIVIITMILVIDDKNTQVRFVKSRRLFSVQENCFSAAKTHPAEASVQETSIPQTSFLQRVITYTSIATETRS